MKHWQKLLTAAAVLILVGSGLAIGLSSAEVLAAQKRALKCEAEAGKLTEAEQEIRSLEIAAAEKQETEGSVSAAETEVLADWKETEWELLEIKETETETVVFNGHVVGIDPGHQGSWVDMSAQEPNGPGSSTYKAKCTSGTTGRFSGVPEYVLNLDISLALKEELISRGYQVIMTREDHDTAISNAERAVKVAEEGGEIYVRIHANGSDDSSVRGALGMTPSPENPYVAALYQDSYRLTECILNSYCTATGFSNLGIQYYDNMTGINWSKVPVTILEMGFMTNESEDYAMQDPQMQSKMVQGIADGIDSYFEVEH